MVLVKAPLTEGVVFPEAQLAIYGNADLFETLPARRSVRARARRRRASSAISPISSPAITWFTWITASANSKGLRQVAVEGATGEFMLLRYAGDAKLYVPLARLDLVQKYQSLGGVEPTLDRLGTAVWEARKTRVRKSVSDMAEQLLALYAERKTAPGHAFPRGFELAARIRGRVRVRGNPRSAARHRRCEARHGIDAADGPPALRRRRLRQDGSGHARGVQGRWRIEAGGRARADHGAGVSALRNVPPALRGVSGAHRNAQPLSHGKGAEENARRSWKREKWTS